MEEPNNEAKCEESEKRGNGDDSHDFVPTLKSYLDMLGLRIVHVPGNGACFYYAMYGTKLLHLEGNSISMSKVHNDGATAMKRAILDCLLDNLDRMIANGDAHAISSISSIVATSAVHIKVQLLTRSTTSKCLSRIFNCPAWNAVCGTPNGRLTTKLWLPCCFYESRCSSLTSVFKIKVPGVQSMQFSFRCTVWSYVTRMI